MSAVIVALAQHNFVDAARRHVNGTRQRVLAEHHRLEELFEQDFAGMRGSKEPVLVVVVDDFDMRRSSLIPDKTYTPLVVDPDRVLSLPVRF